MEPIATTESISTRAPHAAPDRYAQLLNEAASIRGVSLWQDAVKRLRRNWAAMISLYLLVAFGLLAFFTPLMPLQSPIAQDLKKRQLMPPNVRPVSLGVTAYRQKIAELKAQLETAPEAERKAINDRLGRLVNDDPVAGLAYKPGLITQLMIKARVAIFGDYCVPSLLGTDNLGRDLLARIFWGARVSIVVALVAAFVSLVIGVTYGATSGYLGGW